MRIYSHPAPWRPMPIGDGVSLGNAIVVADSSKALQRMYRRQIRRTYRRMRKLGVASYEARSLIWDLLFIGSVGKGSDHYDYTALKFESWEDHLRDREPARPFG